MIEDHHLYLDLFNLQQINQLHFKVEPLLIQDLIKPGFRDNQKFIDISLIRLINNDLFHHDMRLNNL
jgi:hypothetical protein